MWQCLNFKIACIHMHISTKQRLELSGEIFLPESRKRSEIFFFKSAFLSLSFSCTSFWVRMLLYMLASSMHVLYRLFLLSEMICCWFSLSKLGGGGFSRKDCMLLIMLNLFSIFKSLSCYSEFVLVEGFFAGWCGKYWLSSWRRIVQVFLLEKEAKFFAFWLSLFIVYPWNLGAIVQILPWWIPCIGCWMPWSFSYDDSGLVWFCQLALKSFPSFLSFGVW